MPAIWITRNEQGVVDAAFVAAYTHPDELKALCREGRVPELIVAKSVTLSAKLPDDVEVVEKYRAL